MPSTTDIIIKQGETFKMTITYSISGTPVNITGFDARMQLRPSYDSLLLLANLTSEGGGGLTITGAAGKIDVVIPAEKTANITVLEGVYDLEIENPSGEVTRLIGGKFTVSREVTR